MLHPINLPASHLALAKTVELQRWLMDWLCSLAKDADVIDEATTITKLGALKPEVGEWLAWYCKQKDILPAMQHIVGLPPTNAATPIASKIAVLNWFEASLKFPEHFDETNVAPTPWPDELPFPKETNKHLKNILGGFYNKAFSSKRGLPFDSAGNAVDKGLTNQRYKEDFKAKNHSSVCPACDGDYDAAGEEKDHWVAVDYFPGLSVMPLNLVLLCHRCNSPQVKHNKRTFSIPPAKPFEDWFHPWLRPAATGISIKCVNLQPKVKAINLDSSVDRLPRCVALWF